MIKDLAFPSSVACLLTDGPELVCKDQPFNCGVSSLCVICLFALCGSCFGHEFLRKKFRLFFYGLWNL